MGPIHGDLAIGNIVGVGAFVEGHDDVCAEVFLNGDGFFWREAMRGTIDVAFEGYAVIVYFTSVR